MASEPSITTALVRQIVHPLFVNMKEPTRKDSNSPRSADSTNKNKLANPNKGKQSPTNSTNSKSPDLAGQIHDMSLAFATLILVPSNKKAPKSIKGQPVEMILAGLSLGFFVAGQEKTPRIDLGNLPGIDPKELLDNWREWKHNAATPPPLQAVEKHGQDFSWLRKDHLAMCKLERLAAAAQSLASGFTRLQKAYGAPSKSTLVLDTELINLAEGAPESLNQHLADSINIEQARDDTMVVAAREARNGRKVAVLCGASAYLLAGGLLQGGVHNLEEAICMQSTLFFSLRQAAILAEKMQLQDAKGRPVHIPYHGAVLSPSVEVFRQSRDSGYAPSKEYDLAAVLSISMPNRNSKNKEVPFDQLNSEDYDRLLELKFRAALMGATRAGAQVLVVPKLGGGELENLPADVGRALGKALFHHNERFEKLLVVGSTEMWEAVRNTWVEMCAWETAKSAPRAQPGSPQSQSDLLPPHPPSSPGTPLAKLVSPSSRTGTSLGSQPASPQSQNGLFVTPNTESYQPYNGDILWEHGIPAGAKEADPIMRVPKIDFESFTLLPSLLTMSTAKSATKRASPLWATTNQNPMRSECARQLGREMKQKAKEQAKAYRESWKQIDSRLSELCETKYGMSHSKIPAWKLIQCLSDCYDGELPTIEKLQFITCNKMPFTAKRLMPLHELQDALRAWELHDFFKKDIELVFYLYDGEATGKLEESQVAHVLQEIGGDVLTREELMDIKRRADAGMDDGVSCFEFIGMVLRWQVLLVEETEESHQGNHHADEVPCIKTCLPISCGKQEDCWSCVMNSSDCVTGLGVNNLKGKFQQSGRRARLQDNDAQFKRQFMI